MLAMRSAGGEAPQRAPSDGVGLVGHQGLLVAGAGRRHACSCIEYFADDRLQQAAREMRRHGLGNEHQPGAIVQVRPAVEPDGRLEDVLDALHQGWLRRPFRHVHQPLDPQQSIAGVLGERLQQQGQRHGGNGRVEGQDEAADAVGMLRRRRMAWRIRLGHGGSGRKQPFGRHRAECRDSAWRVGVQRRHRVVKLRPGRGDVSLGEQDAASQRHLTACLHMGRQRRGAVHRVNQRQHPGNGVVPGEPGVGHQRMQDRRRVGEAGGLDHHPVERDRTGRSARVQVEQRRHQVALDGAAQAAGRQQQHLAATLD